MRQIVTTKDFSNILRYKTNYTYDARDRLIEVRQDGTEVDGHDGVLDDVQRLNAENQSISANKVTKYHRDIMGRIEAIEDALGNKETYQYSPKGEMIAKLDKDGFLTKYGYNAHSDVTNVQYADEKEVAMSYNALRQLTEINDWLGTTKITVNALGQATKVINHNDQIVEYAYGKTGERTQVVYPDGKLVGYEYDDMLRLTRVNDGNQVINYEYDQFSRLIGKRFGDDVRTEYSFNGLGQLATLSHFMDGNLVDCYQYQYDVLGNKTNIEKARQGLDVDSGLFGYAYDVMNRLIDVTKDGQTIRAYGYDAFGNRSSMTENGNEINYQFNALNQLISSSDGQNYQYDKRGNLTQVTKAGNVVNSYVFGALNRLEKAFNFEQNIGATYRYDGFGNRVGKIEGTSFEPVLPTVGINNLILNPTKQIDDVLDLTKQYHNLLTRNENGNSTSFTFDFGVLSANGNPYLLDDLGSPVRFGEEGLAYDEFGGALSTTKNSVFGFTGYQFDPIANTYFAQAREYSASTGRFVSVDQHWNPSNMIYGDQNTFSDIPSTLRGIFPDPLAMGQANNLYGYTMNNPVNNVDLNGDFIRSLVGGIANLANQVSSDGWSNVSWGEVGRSAVVSSIPIVGWVSTTSDLLSTVGNLTYNDCQNEVQDSRFFSNYRGQIVVRWSPFGRAGSLGPIMLFPHDTSNRTLRHEHGHFLERQELGFWRYYFGIGIPSVFNGNTSPYHNQPWEVHADMLAGVYRSNHHTLEGIAMGMLYFEHLQNNSIFSSIWNVINFTNHNLSTVKEGRL